MASDDSAGNVKIWENTPICDLDFGHCTLAEKFKKVREEKSWLAWHDATWHKVTWL